MTILKVSTSFRQLQLVVVGVLVCVSRSASYAQTTVSVYNGSPDTASSISRSECLDQMKTQIRNRSLRLALIKQPPNSMSIYNVNEYLKAASPSEVNFGFIRSTGTGKALALSSANSFEFGPKEKSSFEYNLRVNNGEDGQSKYFDLEISFVDRRNLESEGTKVVTQNFAVMSECSLALVSTKFFRYRLKGKTLGLNEVVVHPGEQAGSQATRTRSIPLTDVIAEAFEKDIFWNNFHQAVQNYQGGAALYSAGDYDTPVIIFNLLPTSKNLVHRAGPSTQFDVDLFKTPVILEMPPVTPLPGFILTSAESKSWGMILNSMPEKEFWRNVEEASWSNIGIAAQPIKPQQVENSQLLVSGAPIKLLFKTDHELKFSNMSAYWTLSEERKSNSVILPFEYLFTGLNRDLIFSGEALVKDPERLSTDRKLQSSDYVQIKIPEVQKIVSQLRNEKLADDRLVYAKRLAKVVNKLLEPDTESFQNHEIYKLNTSQIIARKKGVCQHYANLFAAVARGSGIPTRIIIGYLVTADSFEVHAWNEIEVNSGVWLPIEPQSSDLKFKSKWYYFPLAVSTTLESKTYSVESADENALINLKFDFVAMPN